MYIQPFFFVFFLFPFSYVSFFLVFVQHVVPSVGWLMKGDISYFD